jgi:PhnB protein
MSAQASPIPAGYHTITPHVVVSDARKAAEFYRRAFGAEIRGMHEGPDGHVMHAEVKIGDSILMLNDEFPSYHVLSPTSTKADTCVTLHLYTDDADKVFALALAAGAEVTMPLEDQFWGDRYGKLRDPFGHSWSIATHIKDMTREEMMAAQEEAMAKMSAAHS